MATPQAGGWRPWEVARLTIGEYRALMAHLEQIGADDGVA